MDDTDAPRAETLSAESLLVAAGRDPSPGAPLNQPLVAASSYRLGAGQVYARSDGSPSWAALEAIIGALEAAEAVAFASGMAGVSAIFDQVGQRRPAPLLVIPEGCYQGTAALAASGRDAGRWQLEVLAPEDTDAWLDACQRADLLWLESPTNPLLVVADLRTLCAAPRKPGALLAVDNTFATALNQRPLDLGADLSFQSATKFIGGHADLLAGIVTTRRPELLSQLQAARALSGATPGALEAFLAARGARTMALRLRRAEASAMVLAERLEAHPAVARTYYPGLPSHPSHALARAQLDGFGAVIAFELRGDAASAEALCARVRLITHATSLGGVETTLERRAAYPGQTHLPPSLIRMSVGIEAVEDLWADLDRALRGG